MPVDKCRLCLLSKDLQDSHFLSKALYKIARKRGGSVVKTPELFIEISNQVHDYLLCRDCEQLFSKNGEDYVMPLVKQDERDFPLLKMLTERVPIAQGPNHGSVYSGSKIGIDTEKLAFYALSMFWRGAVHAWKTINQQTTSIRLHPEDEEAIHKYLLGKIKWPPGIVLQMTVCTDSISQNNVLAPVEWENDMYKGCSMVVFGIFFMMVTGVKPGAPEWNLCCTTPPKSVIFLHTCESTTQMLLGDLRSKAKIADNLKGKKQSTTKT